MEQKSPFVSGAHVGGTAVAIVVAIIVLVVVSVIASMMFGAIQYYLGSMRFEAALFFGVVFGGFAGVHAARAACDAVIKSYSYKAIFVTFALLCLVSFGGEAYKGFDWESISRIAQLLTIAITSWLVFWKNDY